MQDCIEFPLQFHRLKGQDGVILSLRFTFMVSKIFAVQILHLHVKEMNFPSTSPPPRVAYFSSPPPFSDSHFPLDIKKMAANGVKDFFPFLTQTAASNSALFHFLDFVLPDSPYIPTLHLKGLNSDSIVIKYPLVAAAAVAGFIVCLDGGRRLLRLTGTRHQFRGSFSWGMAMLWYALMCFGGFWYHSINHGRFFYKVDVTGTACSCLSIVAGSLGLDDRIAVNRRILGLVYLMATVGVFFGSQLTKELLYLLPTAAAFGFFVKTVVVEFGNESRREEEKEKRKAEIGWYLAVAGFGAASGLVGLVFSRWIMEMMGPNFYPVFWFFFGCEVALWGLFRLVVSANNLAFLVLK